MVLFGPAAQIMLKFVSSAATRGAKSEEHGQTNKSCTMEWF